jgi:hypothetical protein
VSAQAIAQQEKLDYDHGDEYDGRDDLTEVDEESAEQLAK